MAKRIHAQKSKLTGLLQRLFITWNTFAANDLSTYASAGAYSFLLSALPILLMVLVILLRILNTSPDVIRDLLSQNEIFSGFLNASTFLDSVMSIKSVGIFEVIIAVSVFSMARRFFTSLQQGIKVIYRKHGKIKALKENLLVIAGEVILITLIVIMAVFIIAGNTFFNSTLSEHLLTPFFYTLFKNLFRFAPLAIIFMFLFLVYFITPLSRPTVVQSLISAAACTFSLSIVQILFSLFINMSRYNLVYGILSTLIVMILQVYMFFYLFLFFAQFLYVVQFFDNFILSRLYFLPPYDDKNPMKQLERMMFIAPYTFYRRFELKKKAGEIIFTIGEDSTDLYYVWNGSVNLEMPNRIMNIDRGKIFGEFSSIIAGKRTATARAETDVILLQIPSYIFQETIEVDGDLSRRTLLMIADYVRKKNEDTLSNDL